MVNFDGFSKNQFQFLLLLIFKQKEDAVKKICKLD